MTADPAPTTPWNRSPRSQPGVKGGARRTLSVTEVLNTALLTRRRHQLRLSKHEVARAAGLRLRALDTLENGAAGAGLTLSQLYRLATALDLHPADLLDKTGHPTDDQPGVAVTADATRLLCLLLVAGDNTSRDIAARALGWPLARLIDAADDIDRNASNLGITLTRRGYSLRATRATDPDARRRLAILQRADRATRAVQAKTARYIHALATGDPDWGTADHHIRAEAAAGNLTTTRPRMSSDPRDLSRTGLLALHDRVRASIAQPKRNEM